MKVAGSKAVSNAFHIGSGNRLVSNQVDRRLEPREIMYDQIKKSSFEVGFLNREKTSSEACFFMGRD